MIRRSINYVGGLLSWGGRYLQVLSCAVAGAIAAWACCLGLGLALSMLPSLFTSLRTIRRAANRRIIAIFLALSMAYIFAIDIGVEVHIWGRSYVFSAWELKLVMGIGALNLAAMVATPRRSVWPLLRRIRRRISAAIHVRGS